MKRQLGSMVLENLRFGGWKNQQKIWETTETRWAATSYKNRVKNHPYKWPNINKWITEVAVALKKVEFFVVSLLSLVPVGAPTSVESMPLFKPWRYFAPTKKGLLKGEIIVNRPFIYGKNDGIGWKWPIPEAGEPKKVLQIAFLLSFFFQIPQLQISSLLLSGNARVSGEENPRK